ncbi:aminotransferase class V-fold PLP-dependent enzyme [Candidatus Gracilibacteria bacterium]|nr:aminotransferase class V-fold PLP-dependent enzyme [Candidatus Gracilibacteria bacterium]
MSFKFWSNEAKAEAKMLGDFSYLSRDAYYFDSACQTLRPQPVIDAEMAYYQEHNACGGRVKYPWGEIVDEKIEAARKTILSFVGASAKHYSVAFTLNATYGINLVLQQIPAAKYRTVITSDIEHNSVFLPTITYAKQHQLTRLVLARDQDGNLLYTKEQLAQAIVVVNVTSNIDGRCLSNLKQLADDIHEQDGLLLLDCCQTLAHHVELLHGVKFDALFASGHKMYAPSCGFIVITHDLLKQLEPTFLGGGTVGDVQEHDYQLLLAPDELFSRLELGLQDYAAIIGLDAAIKWYGSFRHQQKTAQQYEKGLSEQLFAGMQALPQVKMINVQSSAVVAFYPERVDSHTLAMYLGKQNIMCRSGFFCCHYYLKNKMKYPPLLRVSLGLHNTSEQVDYLLEKLNYLLAVIK